MQCHLKERPATFGHLLKSKWLVFPRSDQTPFNIEAKYKLENETLLLVQILEKFFNHVLRDIKIFMKYSLK